VPVDRRGTLVALCSMYLAVRESSPKQPMPSPRTVSSYLPARGPNDKRADLTGQFSSSAVTFEFAVQIHYAT